MTEEAVRREIRITLCLIVLMYLLARLNLTKNRLVWIKVKSYQKISEIEKKRVTFCVILLVYTALYVMRNGLL